MPSVPISARELCYDALIRHPESGPACSKGLGRDRSVETEFSAIVQDAAAEGQQKRLSWPRPKYLLFGFIG
jgi:hypothetical protein